MVREIADIAELLAARGDHEHGVPHRVPRRGDGGDAGEEFLPVLEEDHAVPVRHEVLACLIEEGLQARPVIFSSVQKS